MKIFQKVKAIIPVMLFSIILPTVDVGTDLNLIYKLYVGTYSCNSTSEMWTEWEDYVKCLETRYSSDLCLHPRERKNTRKQFEDYDLCRQDSYEYCTSNSTWSERFCVEYEDHPRFASSLLTFFMINYFVCLLTFFRLEEEKGKLFILPLLILYPQYGEFSTVPGSWSIKNQF